MQCADLLLCGGVWSCGVSMEQCWQVEWIVQDIPRRSIFATRSVRVWIYPDAESDVGKGKGRVSETTFRHKPRVRTVQ
jgi:hypothetical protein